MSSHSTALELAEKGGGACCYMAVFSVARPSRSGLCDPNFLQEHLNVTCCAVSSPGLMLLRTSAPAATGGF